MKKAFCFLVLFSFSLALFAAKVPRTVEISGSIDEFAVPEIVLQDSSPMMGSLAREFQELLSQAVGRKPDILKAPSGKTLSLVLGDGELARENGIDVSKLPEEGFTILRKGNLVFIAGVDELKHDLFKRGYIYQARSTVYGIYDFLERFAGARFYFPGKYGTLIPARGKLSVPRTIRIIDRPDMAMRSTYLGNDFCWYDDSEPRRAWFLQQIRMRIGSQAFPFCHGLNSLNYVSRYGKSNPEYFALRTDGTRFIEGPYQGQLCFNSAIREQIFQDAKRYFNGVTPQELIGKHYWPTGLAFGRRFCVMPQDGMYWCNCEKCRQIAPGGKDESFSSPKYRQAISDFMWAFTSEIAERLTKEGIDCVINQMAYSPYDKVPQIKLAPNVQVQVAVNGLGGNTIMDRNDLDKMKSWSAKMGHPVMIWTYAQGKHLTKSIPGLPPMMAKHLGDFIDRSAPYIDGGFFEAETECFLFSYLNSYVIAKKLWDPSLSTAELLDEHYRLMFGKGAPFMRKFYESLEVLWTENIIGRIEDTPIGPKPKVPGMYEIWTKLYGPERMREYHGLFASARRAAAEDSAAVERITFIETNLLGKIETELTAYQNAQNALGSWQVTVPGKLWLRALDGMPNEVATTVEIAQKGDKMVFTYHCSEPRMDDIRVAAERNGDPELWRDSGIELLLNPRCDRKSYLQLMVNAKGLFNLYSYEDGKKGKMVAAKGIQVKAVAGKDFYELNIMVPRSMTGYDGSKGVPVNFGRHRALKSSLVRQTYYHWNLVRKPELGFHDLRIWGSMVPELKTTNIIKNANFAEDAKEWHTWLQGGAKDGLSYDFDDSCFISGGKSLHFKNPGNRRINACQELPQMKPNTKYRLSYFIRAKLSGKDGAGAFIYFNKKDGGCYPKPQVNGVQDWNRLVFEFTSPKTTGDTRTASIGLWIWNAAGEVWFDDIRLEEIGK